MFDVIFNALQHAYIVSRLGPGPLLRHIILEVEARMASAGPGQPLAAACSFETEQEIQGHLARLMPWAQRCLALSRRGELQARSANAPAAQQWRGLPSM